MTKKEWLNVGTIAGTCVIDFVFAYVIGVLTGKLINKIFNQA